MIPVFLSVSVSHGSSSVTVHDSKRNPANVARVPTAASLEKSWT